MQECNRGIIDEDVNLGIIAMNVSANAETDANWAKSTIASSAFLKPVAVPKPNTTHRLNRPAHVNRRTKNMTRNATATTRTLVIVKHVVPRLLPR